MRILCVIPSRINSTRIAKKPLLDIGGKPMIQHVYENAIQSNVLTKVIVATDSAEIASVIQQIGGETILTDPNIQTGSDRCAVVAEQYPDMDVVINLQGDEPFVKPSMLKALVQPYLDGHLPDMTTLAYPLEKKNHLEAGVVKVVVDKTDHALYFSRAPIPYFRTETKTPLFHHIGLYAYRRDFLLKYTALPQTPLEKTESLEQLRVLEHGYKIRVCFTHEKSLEINTPEEYQRAKEWIKELTSYQN